MFSLLLVRKMCVNVSRPTQIATFLRKTVTSQDGLLIFFGKKTHPEKSWNLSKISQKKSQRQRQTLNIVENFACEAKNLRNLFEISHLFSFLVFAIVLHFSFFFHVFLSFVLPFSLFALSLSFSFSFSFFLFLFPFPFLFLFLFLFL